MSNTTYPILHIKQYSYTIFTRNGKENTLIKAFCIQVCFIHYINRKKITYYASILPFIHYTHCIHQSSVVKTSATIRYVTVLGEINSPVINEWVDYVKYFRIDYAFKIFLYKNDASCLFWCLLF